MLTHVSGVIESKKVKIQKTHFMAQVGEAVTRKQNLTCKV